VLGLVVTDHIYRTYPELPEGELAKVRASVVNAGVLAEVAAELDLGRALLLGKGEDASGGREKPSILADAMEAVIGAVYLDGGWGSAADLVMRLLGERIAEGAAGPGGQDYKTRLQELAARQFDQLPRYEVADEGPDHAKRFYATVYLPASSTAGARAAPRSRPSRPRPARRGRSWNGSCPRGPAVPELPEVETVKRDLEKEAVGRRIKTVEVHGMRSIRRHPNKKHFISRLEGKKVTGVERKGKYLLMRLEGGDVLVVHLGMSGQLLRAAVKEPLIKHTHVVISFTQGPQLRYVDPRTFGELFVTAGDELEDEVPELAHLGFDPIDDVMSWGKFGALLADKKTKLKPLMMDQKFVAGIGNIYSDEILWAAGLRHDRSSESLSSQEVRRLQRAMIETLNEAIKHRGSSLADEQYRDLFGEVGDYQSQHKVYDREGEACRRCRSPIAREKVSGRSTFFCPRCQV
jgi:formamidopyrimidine-DNA glycosylase